VAVAICSHDQDTGTGISGVLEQLLAEIVFDSEAFDIRTDPAHPQIFKEIVGAGTVHFPACGQHGDSLGALGQPKGQRHGPRRLMRPVPGNRDMFTQIVGHGVRGRAHHDGPTGVEQGGFQCVGSQISIHIRLGNTNQVGKPAVALDNINLTSGFLHPGRRRRIGRGITGQVELQCFGKRPDLSL